MAKPKTKGAPIQVRLPLEVDAIIRAKAIEKGVSPAFIIEGAAILVAKMKVDKLRATIDVSNPADPSCTHPKGKVHAVGSHGIRQCECGMTRGVDGNWR